MLCSDGYDVSWLKEGQQQRRDDVDQILVVRLVDPTQGIGASMGGGRIWYQRSGTVYETRRGQIVIVDQRGVLPAVVLTADSSTLSKFIQVCDQGHALPAMQMLAAKTGDARLQEYLKRSEP